MPNGKSAWKNIQEAKAIYKKLEINGYFVKKIRECAIKRELSNNLEMQKFFKERNEEYLTKNLNHL